MGQLFNAQKLLKNADFLGVVQAAAFKVALDVFAEPAGSTEEQQNQHRQRLGLARTILNEANGQSDRYTRTFAVLCSADNTIRAAGYVGGVVNAEAITDASLISVVTSNWDNVSGGA